MRKRNRSIKVIFLLNLAAAITILVASPAVSQDKQADEMQILREKVKARPRINPQAYLSM
jgi:hypothetical protein